MTSTTIFDSVGDPSARRTGHEIRVAADLVTDHQDAFWAEFNSAFNAAQQAQHDTENAACEAAEHFAEGLCAGHGGAFSVGLSEVADDVVRFGVGFEPPF